MNAKRKAFLWMGIAAIGLAAAIGGGVYVAKNNGELLATPRHALVQMVNESNLSTEDRLYLLESNAQKVDQTAGVGVFDKYIVDKLPPDQKVAYISGEVGELNPDSYGTIMDSMVKGAGVPDSLDLCFSNVYKDAGPTQQLRILEEEIKATPTKNYGSILGTMAENFGTGLYNDIIKLFSGGQ